jgi:hypothetical protein
VICLGLLERQKTSSIGSLAKAPLLHREHEYQYESKTLQQHYPGSLSPLRCSARSIARLYTFLHQQKMAHRLLVIAMNQIPVRSSVMQHRRVVGLALQQARA